MKAQRHTTDRRFVACLLLCPLAARGLRLVAQNGWTASTPAPGTEDLTSVFFADAQHGWVGADAGHLYRTVDGGKTWTRQYPPASEAISDIHFRNADTGYILSNNAVLGSHDGGAHWTTAIRFPQSGDGDNIDLYSIHFASDTKGWVVGSVSRNDNIVDNVLIATEDGGQTWTQRTTPTKNELMHLDFVDDAHGWLVGADGTVLATTDGGQHWIKQTSGTDALLYHVDFTSQTLGWVVGERGTMLRTESGGRTWSAVSTGSSATLMSVQFVDDLHGWTIGKKGVILQTEDGGKTWKPQPTQTSEDLYGLHAAADGAWAAGARGTLLRHTR